MLIANITWNLTGCKVLSGGTANPTPWVEGSDGVMVCALERKDWNMLPETITVTGCEYIYDRRTDHYAILTLKVPTSDISVTVTATVETYNITWNLTNVNTYYGTPSTIEHGGTARAAFAPYYNGYVPPSTITVTNCEYTWEIDTSQSAYILTLFNPADDVTVTINGSYAGG
jgi:hypothetical protein